MQKLVNCYVAGCGTVFAWHLFLLFDCVVLSPKKEDRADTSKSRNYALGKCAKLCNRCTYIQNTAFGKHLKIHFVVFIQKSNIDP